MYIGWRKGVIYLPAGVLNAGDNDFQFAVKDATASTPLAVKDLLLQLNYKDNGAAADATATGTAVAPAPAAAIPDATPAQPALPPAAGSGSNGLIFYRFNGSTILR